MTGPAELADGTDEVEPVPVPLDRVRREPVVLRFHGRRGWAHVDLGRRGFAVLFLLLLVAWLVLASIPEPLQVGPTA